MAKVHISILLERLNAYCLEKMQATAADCGLLGLFEVSPVHFFSQLVEAPDADIACILKRFGLDRAALLPVLNNAVQALNKGNTGRPAMSPELINLLQDAWLVASLELEEKTIRSGAVLLALCSRVASGSTEEYAHYLRTINRDTLLGEFSKITQDSIESGQSSALADTSSRSGDGISPQEALERFCVNLSEKAARQEIDPVFGRDREMRQLIDILLRRRKNNPIIVGDAGVGKTAVVEGLAQRIAAGDVPAPLKNVNIMTLDIGLLEAGAGMKGEFEARLKAVIAGIRESATPIILFIDEAHTIIGAGGKTGGSDAANLLKPALARGELRTIAATTWPEYKKYFEKDQALSRRFLLVKIEEPSVEATIDILRGLKRRYERDHEVHIRHEALVAAAELSHRYISGRLLPDKAVDLLDTSAARVRISLTHKPAVLEDKEHAILSIRRHIEALHADTHNGAGVDAEALNQAWEQLQTLKPQATRLEERWNKERTLAHHLLALRQSHADLQQLNGKETPTESDDADQDEMNRTLRSLREQQGEQPLIRFEVDAETVAMVVSDWTGIPLGKVLRDHARSVLNIETNLSQRIKGQPNALRIIGKNLKAAKSGLKNPNQPLGAFLLVGPSGVGKTETALVMADLLFGDESALIALNMSEFQERHSVSRLIGAPPGYAGYGEGGLLTEAVRRRPYSVLLLDEAEKAHIEVINLFLQVFDKGSLADSEGRVVDFRNTIVFLTTNLASDFISGICADEDKPLPTILKAIRPVLSDHFKPGLLARMVITPYYPLRTPALKDITRLKLQKLAQRLQRSGTSKLDFSEKLVARIVESCTDAEAGARNIDYILADSVLPKVSEEILARMVEGKMPRTVFLDCDTDNGYQVRFGAD